MEQLLPIFVPFAKIMLLVIQGIYVLFAFMLTRQVKIMNKNFNTGLAHTFSFFAFINLVAAFVVMAATFFLI